MIQDIRNNRPEIDDRSNRTVIIIGNGFDRNLGLKTGYGDFIQSPFFKNILDKNELAKHLKSKCDTEKRWIDIETELSAYSIRNVGVRMNKEEVRADFLELKNALIEYLKSIDKKTKEDSCVATLFTELIHYTKPDILNFNYTSTILSFIDSVNYYPNGNKADRIFGKRVDLHGQLTDEKSIVFGVEDSATIKKEHIFLRKAYQFDSQIDIYPTLQNKKNIFFIGHSLGRPDYTYFETFFEACSSGAIKNKNIFFTYYDIEGLEQTKGEIDELTGYKLSRFKTNNYIYFIDTNDTDAFVSNELIRIIETLK